MARLAASTPTALAAGENAWMWRSWARPRAMPRCFVAALWTFSSPSARRHGCLEEMRQTLEVDRLQHAL